MRTSLNMCGGKGILLRVSLHPSLPRNFTLHFEIYKQVHSIHSILRRWRKGGNRILWGGYESLLSGSGLKTICSRPISAVDSDHRRIESIVIGFMIWISFYYNPMLRSINFWIIFRLLSKYQYVFHKFFNLQLDFDEIRVFMRGLEGECISPPSWNYIQQSRNSDTQSGKSVTLRFFNSCQ